MHARGPCIFCGEPYRFESPIKITRFHFRILGGLGILLFVILFARCLQSTSYVQANFLRGPEMRKATRALGQGRTGGAREAAGRLYDQHWYSGFPGVVIAASHYRDYMKYGKMHSLDVMRRYITKAHDTDPSFATRYYYGLWLYEKGEYDEAIEQARTARAELTGVTRWADVIDRTRWQKAISELKRASEEGLRGRKLYPIYLPLDGEPGEDKFEVEFEL